MEYYQIFLLIKLINEMFWLVRYAHPALKVVWREHTFSRGAQKERIFSLRTFRDTHQLLDVDG